MATTSSIEWTEVTWNPVTGCSKVSPGCKHCYAERMAGRLKAMGVDRYENGFRVTLQEDMVELPLAWKKSRVIFVNSMSDLFHRDVPINFIRRIYEVMNKAPQHEFQILTKRADRLEEIDRELSWTKNIWMGVSVESADYYSRIESLKNCRALIKFLSLEPLLGPLKRLPLKGIDWVIAGGESGHTPGLSTRGGFGTSEINA